MIPSKRLELIVNGEVLVDGRPKRQVKLQINGNPGTIKVTGGYIPTGNYLARFTLTTLAEIRRMVENKARNDHGDRAEVLWRVEVRELNHIH